MTVVTFNRKDAPERQILIPSEFMPEGRGADPHRHDLHRRLAVVRANLLFGVESNEAKDAGVKGLAVLAASGSGDRRYLAAAEALVPIARPYPFLNSDVPDHSGGLHA